MQQVGTTVRPTQHENAVTLGLLLCMIIGTVGLALLLPPAYRVPVTLGVVQGLSEFLPISSSAHLILVPRLLGWPDPGLTFDVALHLGTLLAVVGYFWRDWLRLVRQAHRPATSEGRLFWLLVLATLPGGLVGLALDKLAENQLRSLLLIAGTSASMGVVLWLADRYAPQRKALDQVTWRDALLVGLAQAVAIIPGVSRSGITIATSRARSMTRETAARFSFLLSTPIIAGAALYKLRDLPPQDLSGPFFAGTLANMPVLQAHDLYRFYHIGDDETLALRGVSLDLVAGEFVAVVGPSGRRAAGNPPCWPAWPGWTRRTAAMSPCWGGA